MKCKSCKREIDEDSIFCKWCGTKLLKERSEISVPKPRKLSSGSYSAQVMVDGQRVTVTGESEKDYYAKARATKQKLIEIKKAPPSVTLNDAITRYISSREGSVSPGTIAIYEKKRELYFQSLMQDNIYAISTDKIQCEIATMLTIGGKGGKPLSPKTVRDAYGFLSAVLKYNNVIIDRDKISLPEVPDSPFSILTEDEISILLEAVKGDPCELQILLALWLGERRSELIALEKSDFDLAHKTVTISKNLVRDKNGAWVLHHTKRGKSVRVIACPDRILDLVRNADDGRIFKNDPNYPLKRLKIICEREGLPEVRLHDLRHINASVGLKLGISDKYMMERGGWTQKDTMVYRYQHTYATEKELADAAINTYFEGLETSKKLTSPG